LLFYRRRALPSAIDHVVFDYFNVSNWIDGRTDVMDVAIFETAHHLHNRVHFADVMEELIPQPFTFARAFDQTGNINEFNGGWDNLFGMRNLRDFFQAQIRHGHDAHVWIDSTKRIIFRRRLMGTRNGVKKRRLPDVWKTNYSGAEHDFLCSGGLRPPQIALEVRVGCEGKSGSGEIIGVGE
jgi:hypothetical protein